MGGLSFDAEYLKKAESALGPNNQDIWQSLKLYKRIYADTLRLFLVNADAARISPGFVTNVSIVLARGHTSVDVPIDKLLKDIDEGFKSQYTSGRLISSTVTRNGYGLEIGIIEFEPPINLADGTSVSMYEKQLVVKLKQGICAITFSTSKNVKETTLPLFDPFLDTIKLLE